MNIKWFSKLQNRLTFLFGGLVLIVAIAVALYIGHAATQIIVQERGKELSVIGKGLARNLGQTLNERMREVRLLSKRSELVHSELDAPIIEQQLNLVKENYPYYAWIGIANADGKVTAAAGELLKGQSVEQRPWFHKGLEGDYIGDAHEAVLLAKELPNQTPDEPLRFVDFASPIYSPNGEVRGVVATHASWSWVRDVVQNFLPGDNSHRVESVDGNDEKGLGWQIVIRQPQEIALKNVSDLQRTIIIAGLAVVLIAVFLSYWLANSFSQPIRHLVRVTNRIQKGEEATPIQVNTGLYELEQLSHSLRGMTDTLIRRKQKLEENNRLLEERVRQRTEELAIANKELEHSLRHDPLTKIFNRLAFTEALSKEFKRMQRSQNPFSIILMDVDHFKKVNDSYGHSTGDDVLVQIAAIMKQTIRETDLVARLGGEEFVVLLPDTSEDAVIVAEKIKTAIADFDHPKVGQVTISAGIATSHLEDADGEVALNKADKAMYQAKESGRNNVKRWG
ncbi:MAG: diguanylate cyclase [Idiomarina sp.]|nr:diguanylate cyclase [Idiomarina sp.]